MTFLNDGAPDLDHRDGYQFLRNLHGVDVYVHKDGSFCAIKPPADGEGKRVEYRRNKLTELERLLRPDSPSQPVECFESHGVHYPPIRRIVASYDERRQCFRDVNGELLRGRSWHDPIYLFDEQLFATLEQIQVEYAALSDRYQTAIRQARRLSPSDLKPKLTEMPAVAD